MRAKARGDQTMLALSDSAPEGAPAYDVQPAPVPVAPKPTRREYAGLIQALADDGLPAREIGRRLGLTRQRVMKIAGQFNLALQPRGYRRRAIVHFKPGQGEIIRLMAEAAGVSFGTMVMRMAAAFIEHGQATAQRKLGKQARPTRVYAQRGGRP